MFFLKHGVQTNYHARGNFRPSNQEPYTCRHLSFTAISISERVQISSTLFRPLPSQSVRICVFLVAHIGFYCATACNAMHGIVKAFLSVSLSVCLSNAWINDKTTETCAHILIPHERAFILVF